MVDVDICSIYICTYECMDKCLCTLNNVGTLKSSAVNESYQYLLIYF